MSQEWHCLPDIAIPSPAIALASDGTRCWAGGYGGIVARTGDDPWMARSSGLPVAPVTALAWGGGTLIAGGAGGLATSADGGASWRPAEIEGSPPVVSALAASPRFEEDAIALAGTPAAGIWRTQDGGRTWRPATFGLADPDVIDLAWGGDGIVIAATASGIARSPNQGRAWKLVHDTGDCAVVAIAALGDGSWLAATERGDILRSKPDGSSWGAIATLPDDVLPAALLSSGEAIVLGTSSHGIWRSQDGGGSWSQQADGTVLALSGAGSTLLAGTTTGILSSSDLGHTWRPLLAPPLGDWQHLLLVDGAPLVYGPQSGPVRHGPDGWTPLSGAPEPLAVMAVAPDGTLLAAGPEGLARSTDGGASWKPVVTGDPVAVTHITFAPDGTGWAGGSDGLLQTADGGRSWTHRETPFGVLPLVALQAIDGMILAATRDPRRNVTHVWRSPNAGDGWIGGLEVTSRWPRSASLAEPALLTLGGTAIVRDRGGAWHRVTITGQGGMRQVTGWGDRLVGLSSAGLHWSHDRGLTWHEDNQGLDISGVLDVALVGDRLTVLLTGGRVWTRPIG